MNVHNTSDTTLNDLAYFAGAAGDELGEDLFTKKHVELQAYDPDTKTWEGLEGPEGEAVGFVGWSDELKPDYEVTLPLRINVKAAAPVGAGFSLGASLYSSGDGECEGFGEVAYKFQIVKAGTDTGGSKPQEGGKVPVTTEKPSKGSSGAVVEGSLAETGSSSIVPTIGIIGGIAVVAGAGVVFTMKRRRANGATA
ncbi:LPXTG cell wall anchor domain-containing protein [Streptomyces albipurpureus]|nr:LPXTG cell wall anchor domain-containing protein [Streptomyces sp. CWNU-1]